MTNTLRDDDLLSTEDDPELVAHLRDSIRDLEVRLARAEQEALGAELAHHREVEIISNEMNEQADEHELCGVYDSVVANVNALLKVPLIHREVDVSVRIRGTVTFNYERRVELSVPMGVGPNDDLVRQRVAGVLTSLGIRTLAMSAVPETVDIAMDPLTW